MAEHETKDVAVQGVYSASAKNNQPDDVDSRHPAYTSWMKDSLLERTLMKGTQGMKDEGKEFLPQDPLETNARYLNRLSRSTLFNMYRKTVQFLSGLVFQSSMVIPEELVDDYVDDFRDIDKKGNSLDVFSKRFLEAGLAAGVSHIMVEADKKIRDNMSKAEEKELGIRPYFRMVDPTHIIGWLVDATGKLEQVRIVEHHMSRVGKYGFEVISAIRVLSPGEWEVHTKSSEDDSYKITDSGTSSIKDDIPIATFIPGEEKTRMTGETPLKDLAELNRAHWCSSSDQNNILHIARVPILFSKMLDMGKMETSTAVMINSDNEKGDMKFVEHSGKAIESGQVDLDKLEEKMTMYGLQQTVSQPGSITATEKSINTAESNSSLSTYVGEFETTMETALGWYSQLKGRPEDDWSELKINKNFMTSAIAATDSAVLISAVEKLILSKEVVFREFVRRGLVDENTEWEDVVAQIEKEAQSSPGNEVAAFLGGGFLTSPNENEQ